MKHIFFLVFIIGFAASFTSCKKCYQCVVKDADDEIQYYLQEICGSKKDYEGYQDVCENGLKDDEVCDCSEE